MRWLEGSENVSLVEKISAWLYAMIRIHESPVSKTDQYYKDDLCWHDRSPRSGMVWEDSPGQPVEGREEGGGKESAK